MAKDSAQYFSELHQLLNQYFSLEEIRTLCFQLNVDFEGVAGEEKPSRIRELLLSLARGGRLTELISIVERERPLVDWPTLPDDFQLPDSRSIGKMAVPSDQYHVYGDVVHGDKVAGDKIEGDHISGINISNTEGIAFGTGSSVNIQKTIVDKQIVVQGSAAREKPKLSFEPETLLIPTGNFIMGSDVHDQAEAPQHVVELAAFRLGVYPLTNEEFAHFIWTTGRVAAKELLWDGNQPPDERLRHPVMGVTWVEALAYCQWLSQETGRAYSLPSEAQWEKAARGTDGRLYPWGDNWELKRCNTDPDSITAVDAFPAQSPFGCFDLVGNLREWTTTLWGDSPQQQASRYTNPWNADSRDALDAPATTRRIFRGGRGSDPTDYRCSKRGSYLPDRPGPRHNRHGFRVVLAVS